MKDERELVIIGAGPAGYPAAFYAADMGMDVTLIDPEKNPGGVCLYRGCVPSKALLHVTKVLYEIEQSAEWGLRTAQPDIDVDTLREWKNSVISRLTGGLGQLAEQRNIDYIQGRAHFKDAHQLVVQPTEGADRQISFKHAVVATGSIPAMIPGVPKSRRVMTSRKALDVEHVPSNLLVVGGGYIGLELGQVYASLGAKITVVEMMDDILPGADRDLVRYLVKRLDRQFEDIFTGTKITNMEETEKGIRVSYEGGANGEATFDKVMLSVGRKPLTEGVGLEKAGVRLNDRGFIDVDEQRRTSVESVYAIGDVAGQPMLAHKATHEAYVAVEAIAGKKTVFDPRAIPFVVFSDPAVAWCGLTEPQARRRRQDVKVTTFPWLASGRAVTLSRTDGITKMLTDPGSGRILGVGMAGHGAAELLAEATLAIEMGAVADDLALTIHTHPTLSETIMEAARQVSGHSTHYLGGKNRST
jgi:dihydrolipoamide dehydrogenase